MDDECHLSHCPFASIRDVAILRRKITCVNPFSKFYWQTDASIASVDASEIV